MAKSLPHITEAELKLMKVLWRRGEATVRDVLSEIESEGGEAPAYTTVMTLMNQLAAKGALRVDKSRQPFLYEPSVRRESVLRDRLSRFLQTVFDGQAGELVLRLVEDAELSPEELRRIEQRIEERERKADSSSPDAKPREGR